VWLRVLRAAGYHHLTPMDALSIVDWWVLTRKRAHKSSRKAFDTCSLWSLWLERNARLFNSKSLAPWQLCAAIREEGRQWKLAGYRHLE
jgi:hypothetical protein